MRVGPIPPLLLLFPRPLDPIPPKTDGGRDRDRDREWSGFCEGTMGVGCGEGE